MVRTLPNAANPPCFFSCFTKIYALQLHRAMQFFSFFSQLSFQQYYVHGCIGPFLYLVHSGKEAIAGKLLSNLWKIWTFLGQLKVKKLQPDVSSMG